MACGDGCGNGGEGDDSAVQPHSKGGERRDTHKNKHTGMYTRMLHLPLATYPLKSARLLFFVQKPANPKEK